MTFLLDKISVNNPISALRTPFIPQIGDYVVYIPAAHSRYVEELEIKLNVKLRAADKVPRVVKSNPSFINQELRCKVSDIQFEFLASSDFKENPLRWLVITLDFTMAPLHHDTGKEVDSLEIRFAPVSDCEEFIVFGPLYDEASRRHFRDTQKCIALFDEHDCSQWFRGTVVESHRKDAHYQRYLVFWPSDQQKTRHSSWELMPDSESVPDTTLQKYHVKDSIPGSEIERISAIIRKVIDESEFGAFNQEVEEEFKAEYWKTIPYPTNLTLIADRLETNYYRRADTLLWELDLLHQNCKKFNGDTDEKSNNLFSVSKILADGLSSCVNQESATYDTFNKYVRQQEALELQEDDVEHSSDEEEEENDDEDQEQDEEEEEHVQESRPTRSLRPARSNVVDSYDEDAGDDGEEDEEEDPIPASTRRRNSRKMVNLLHILILKN